MKFTLTDTGFYIHHVGFASSHHFNTLFSSRNRLHAAKEDTKTAITHVHMQVYACSSMPRRRNI